MNINTEKEYSNARFNRKELKACAKRTFKSHYVLFVIVCLFAAFIGAEFSTTLSAISTGIETGEQVAGNGTELVSILDYQQRYIRVHCDNGCPRKYRGEPQACGRARSGI